MDDSGAVARDYDRIAEAYARELGDELDGKPLDRALLAYVAGRAAGRPVGDLGCGPGHVSRHLAALGCDVVGVDLSPGMIAAARAAAPDLRFLEGDLRALPLPDAALGAAVALYSLIHLDADGVRAAAREIARVLAPGGEALVAYHRGDEVVRPGEMWGTPVGLGFRFLRDEEVVGALESAGLTLRARIHREPYAGVEHPSRRTYLVAER